MHRTDTIDVGFVLSGEVVIELEGGGEQTMRPGDAYALNAPYDGGTHLPDITVVMPVFAPDDRGETEAEPARIVGIARLTRADRGVR